MTTIDYNPPGDYSTEALIRRYGDYCSRFGVLKPLVLAPRISEQNGKRWVYPLMEQVVEGVAAGDRACIEIAVEHIECGQPVPFGRIIRSNLARNLRRQMLEGRMNDRSIQERLRRHFVNMLPNGHCGREYRDYRRLFVAIGPGHHLPEIRKLLESENPYVRKHAEYLVSCFESTGQE